MVKNLDSNFFYEWGVKSLNLAAWGKLFGKMTRTIQTTEYKAVYTRRGWDHSKEYVHLEGMRGGGGRYFTQIEPN